MTRWLTLALSCWACASGTQSASEPEVQSETSAPAPTAAPAPTEVEQEPPAPAAQRDASAALPPLSTPNARPEAGAEAGATGTAPSSGYEGADERTRALARGGTAAQRCHDQHAPRGAGGKLALRITLAPSGKPARVEVDRSASTTALLGGKFEACVIAAFEKESFPAPRGADVLLEVPLRFHPPAAAP